MKSFTTLLLLTFIGQVIAMDVKHPDKVLIMNGGKMKCLHWEFGKLMCLSNETGMFRVCTPQGNGYFCSQELNSA